ncbi:chemotaxis protein CheX [Desulfobulbus elongatus]|uniref:chemotaxis protein CheX n=1 Tax=Desulfobulbus elongatus TaxID=53332 RepID=UPI00048A37CE|nr:chemotaxis protein CheX [Desulfobulbus elongatus]
MELEQYLVDATMEVFASMISIDIAPEPKGGGLPAVAADISSLIGLAGDFKGFLAVHCPEPVALGITSAMLGMEVTAVDDEVKDALGEVANMVAGGLKIGVATEGKKIGLAIATTVVGKALRTGGLSGADRAAVAFATPLGRFGVEVRFVLS